MKFKKSLLALTAGAALSLSGQTMANDTVDEISNAWTQCGIGGMLFKELPVAAAISNIIWDLGTTAVISMAASPDTCKGVRVAAAVFINESIDSIEADLAKGEGKHMTAMLNLMGVEGKDHAKVAASVRTSIAQNPEFLGLPGTEKAQNMYAIVERAAAIS